jgi:hypothetical protein
MADTPIVDTSDLSSTLRALKNGDPLRVSKQNIQQHPDYKRVPNNNYAPVASAHTGSWGNGMSRFASGSGIIYGQPQFFSPVHTPINWQIPSKTLEENQWSRFFYSNEPKVASAIDFYSYYPMSDWDHECKDRKVKKHFDKLKERLDLIKWCRLISHEVHLLGNCYPLVEISCEHCNGTGRIGGEVCEHEGGTIKRVVILNPDFVEVFTNPLNPDPIIALKPDEELINMVQRKTPGFEKLDPEVIKLVSSGQPIRLDNRNIAHIKYGECGYTRFGIGMVRRLFPILSYKTKLMVAQWIVAERLIVPIKIVKVGSDERPAGPADIAAVQAQLAQTANDPNLTIVTHHAFDLNFYGASGQVLTLSNEFELINQEILDGMMINNALLNGEGPAFASAAVGIEAMIQRLTTFRRTVTQWLVEYVYKPEARRQGFFEIDEETGEEELIIPKIKWHSMHLRDQQQHKQFVLQLYEKGLLSVQTVLEQFEFDADLEIERKRYDAVQLMAVQGSSGEMGGGFGGEGGDMGDMGGMGGMPDMGGGGEPPISPPGGAMGGPPGDGGGPVIAKSTEVSEVDPSQFDGKILKKKTRDKLISDQQKIFNEQEKKKKEQEKSQKSQNDDVFGPSRDEKGRIIFTKPERQLIEKIQEYISSGLIKYPVVPQFDVKYGNIEYPIDFAIPNLKIGIEADGEVFHGSPKQIQKDKERDMKLAHLGWTIIRFTDDEIDKKINQVMNTIVKTIMEKEEHVSGEFNKNKYVK